MHKFRVWVRCMTPHYLPDLYGTYLRRVFQNESKDCGTSSLNWIVYKIWLTLFRVERLILVSQLSVSSDVGGGIQVNNTHTTTIFSERRMFCASNAKTNIIQSVMWFLHTSKEMVRTIRIVQVVKKWIRKPSSTFPMNFAFSLKKCLKRWLSYQRRLSETNVWVIRAFKNGIKNSKTVKSQFMTK